MPFGCADLGARGSGSRTLSASSEGKKDFWGVCGGRGAANMVQNVILVFFRRRLSQRPAVEELESRNILKRK